MKRIQLFAILALLVLNTYSQKMKGKVVDETNNTPLQGATIFSSGKAVATTYNNGTFSIDCKENTEIMVSFIGYETYRKIIKDCSEVLLVKLTPAGQSLNDVDITATSNTNKSILYQPSSITKLNKTELQRGTAVFLDDALNTNVPGVMMERRSVSGGQQIDIRGYGSGVGFRGASNNFDGQGYKVYLNGIPVTDAEGITVMDDIDFNSVGNVEISKGPSGTLYGLAIAGVVNLETIQPEKGTTLIGQDVMIGNYGLQRYTTHFQTATDRSSLLVNYGYQKSDGFMTHNASKKNFINIAGNFQSNEKQTINAYFGYSNSYDERGGELTIDQYESHDYSGNPFYIKNNAHSEIIGFRAGLGQTYNFNSHVSNTTTVFASGITNNSSSAAGWTDKDPINYGLRSTLDTRFTLGGKTVLNGITGVETQQQHAQTIGYGMVADSSNLDGYNRIGSIKSNQYTISTTTSVFTEWTLSLPKDVLITAGIGLSNMKIKLNDRLYVSTSSHPSQYAATYNGMFSPHIAVNKVFSKQFSVYAAYSKGYKAPVSSYFFIPSTGELNTGLKPEIGNQYEIGTKGQLLSNKLQYQLALFDAIFSDKMTSVAVPLNSSTTAYTYIANGGKQNDKGIEALIKYTAYHSTAGFFKMVSTFANITYAKFKYEDFKFETLSTDRTESVVNDYSDKEVAGVAPVVANIGVDIAAAAGLYANVNFNHRDAMPITSDNMYYTSSFNLLNAKLGIQRNISEHFDINVYFGVNNISGTHYYNMVFTNQLPDAYLPGPDKANYYGGINLNYIF